MAVKYGFTVFFADIDQTLLPLVMVGGYRYDLPAVGPDPVAAMDHMEMDGIVNGMGLKTVN